MQAQIRTFERQVSHQPPRILVADRVSNIAAFIKHLDFSATITRPLTRIR